MKLQPRWSQRLRELQSQGLQRQLASLELLGPTRARIGSQQVHVFSSNDYLGLASHPELLSAWGEGGGAGSSRLISGTRPAHLQLEAALEEKFGRPALVFSSGYQANLAVLTTLLEETITVGSDRLNHASIIDGLRLSAATVEIVAHGCFSDLADLHVVEGLYSMDGDVLDLSIYSTASLIVDEAHSVGCIGPEGRGVAALQGVEPDVLVGTFGKAYGAAGAFVVCSQEAKELLVSVGRSFVYTTALADSACRAALVGLQMANSDRRDRLAENTQRFRRGLVRLGLPTLGDAHIVPVVLGDATMGVAAALLAQGFFVPGIRFPTVKKGAERLRFSLSTEHSFEDIDAVLEALARCCCS
jgi:8-amino-7-oxononanoate synthase